MKKKLMAITLLSALSAPVFADDTNFYVGIDYIQMSLSNLSSGISQPTGGFGLDFGYNFNKNWGAEIGYLGSGNTSDAAGNTLTPNDYYVAGVGTYPINDMFDVLAKVGVAMNQLTGAATNGCTVCGVQTGLMFGIGVDYNINKNLGVRLQWESLGNMEGSPSSGSQITGSNTALGLMMKF